MVFNSATFLIFFAIFFPLYIVCQGRVRIWLTLIASNIFYAGWDWRFLGLIWLSTAINHVSGLSVRGDPRVLRVCIVANLGLLGLFKYFNFFVGSAAQLLNALGFAAHQPTLEIILPIGISFYTFHCLSYVIDVHRADMEPEPNFLNFATYVTLFPQLVAGPIVRARHLLPQIAKGPQVTWNGLAHGTEMVLWGFVLKLCLADNAAPYVDGIFRAPELSTHVADALGVFAFALQIYGDFAGYSLIAIGIGRMMGFDFGRNFDTPYFARSFGEFWQRWHISLSTWLRDYLFIPLGGSTGSRAKTFRNLVVTMFLGGLWHGASWVFVIWGLLHGAYLILERLVSPPLTFISRLLRLPAWLSGTVAALAVFSLTCLAWIFFRAATLADATSMLRRVLSFQNYEMTLGAIPQEFWLIFSMALLVTVVDGLGRSERITGWYRASAARRLAGGYAMLGVILLFGSFAGPRFIYFQF
jgi:D-alanyl-lipoteichoic acid acyltransferase DltB (MBOAT superfamily)